MNLINYQMMMNKFCLLLLMIVILIIFLFILLKFIKLKLNKKLKEKFMQDNTETHDIKVLNDYLNFIGNYEYIDPLNKQKDYTISPNFTDFGIKHNNIQLNDNTFISIEKLKLVLKNIIAEANQDIDFFREFFITFDQNTGNTLYGETNLGKYNFLKKDINNITIEDINTIKKIIIDDFETELKKFFEDETIKINNNLFQILEFRENDKEEYYNILFDISEEGSINIIYFNITLFKYKKEKENIHILTLKLVGSIINSTLNFRNLHRNRYHLNKENKDCSLVLLNNPDDTDCSFKFLEEEENN